MTWNCAPSPFGRSIRRWRFSDLAVMRTLVDFAVFIGFLLVASIVAAEAPPQAPRVALVVDHYDRYVQVVINDLLVSRSQGGGSTWLNVTPFVRNGLNHLTVTWIKTE